MKNFTKNFIMICGIYALTQIPMYSTVFAASNTVDKSSVESSITQVQQNKSADDSTSTLGNVSNVDNKSQNTYANSNISVNTNDSSQTTVTNEAQKATSETSIDKTIDNVITRDNVAVTKSWNIKFSEPVDINTLTDKIKLTNVKTGEEIPIEMTADKLCETITVTSSVKLDPQTEYSLSISQDIVSKFGRQLSNPTVLNFKTAAIISSISNITKTISQGDSFTLPDKVTAVMSDGTTSQVSVSWDKSSVNINVAGNYTFNGTVKDYGTVTLNLTVKPLQSANTISNGKRTQSSIGVKLYNYLINYTNRNAVLTRAIQIHAAQGYGDDPYSNNCAFYQSEALRSVGVNVPNSTANTATLTNVLLGMGWVKSSDLSLLLPGDICFTIGYGNGPTHTYTFMKWVDPKDFHYAYVCDNQGDEYAGDAYHERNIDFQTSTKDKISYFMYLPV
jgi:hypothetical protein